MKKKNIILSLGVLSLLPAFVACKPSSTKPDDSTTTTHEHTYGDVSYTYSEDMEHLTASKKCTVDGCTNEVSETVDLVKTVTKEPTCTESGSAVYTSNNFTDTAFKVQTKNVTLEALGHDIIHHNAVSATCETDGYLEYDTCSRCDYSTTYTKVDKLNHDYWTSYDWNEDLTQVTATRHCRNNENETVTETVDVTEQILYDSSCLITGSKTLYATFTNPFFEEQHTTVEIPKKEHHLVTISGKTPTCSEDGYREKIYCDVCMTVIQEATSLPPVEHNYVRVGAVEATCTQEGATGTLECSFCHKVLEESQVISKTAHTEVIDPEVLPTCSNSHGKTQGSHCSVCGLVIREPRDYEEEVPHLIEYIEAKEATCYEEGHTEGQVCTVCGTYIVEPTVIPKSHVLKHMDAEEATCTREGFTEGEFCVVCEQIISGHESLGYADHKLVTIKGTVPMHYGELGTTDYISCEVCGETIQEGKTYGFFDSINVAQDDNMKPATVNGVNASESTLSILPTRTIDSFTRIYSDGNGRILFVFSEFAYGPSRDPRGYLGIAVDESRGTNKSSLANGEYAKVKITLKDGTTVEKTISSYDCVIDVDVANIESFDVTVASLYARDVNEWYTVEYKNVKFDLENSNLN